VKALETAQTHPSTPGKRCALGGIGSGEDVGGVDVAGAEGELV